MKLNRSILSLITFSAGTLALAMTFCQPAQAQKIEPFKLQEVKLLNGVFKEAEQTDLNYMLALDPDRLLAPYLLEAGLPPKAKNYPNWENTGLDGHIGGHYLSALALMYASTGDARISQRLNYMLAELKKCQQRSKGYTGGVPGGNALWADIADGKIEAGTFDLNKKWVPLYNIHKTIAGLRDVYLYTGNEEAKAMFLAYGDWFLWLTAKLSDAQIASLLLSEYGGLNEVFADLYQLSSNKQFLKLAYQFSDQRILQPLTKKEDQLNGWHANTQIPKVIGFKRIADLNNDSTYNQASHFFWETVVHHRTVANGGNSVREHFNPMNDFSSMISSVEGPETCNSYNMLKLTKAFYESEGSAAYIDYYERTLYNHILSSQHPGTGGFVYFTPMRPGHYRVYSQPQSGFWCCVGSGLENHAKYNELIYAHDKSDVYVNLFIASELNWKEQGLRIRQETNFPDTDNSRLTVLSAGNKSFGINIRFPIWAKAESFAIKVNGKMQQIGVAHGNYVRIERKWKTGDKIDIVFPMEISTEQLPDKSNYVAVLKGPILLAAKTDTTDLKGLFADESRMGHIAGGTQYPLQDMPVFVSNNDDYSKSIKAISGKQSMYTAQSLIYPEKYKNLELMPFYKLHDSRYVIYWKTETPGSLKESMARLEAAEKEKLALNKITLDMVFPGEQQPESDHFIQTENSENGISQDRHWRSARGWFTYTLKDEGKRAGSIRITYHGKDAKRSFNILADDVLVAAVKADKESGDRFYSVDYPLPDVVLAKNTGKINIRFVADAGSETARIYEVRLIKK